MTKSHPPKIEIFDVEANTNTDPKGIVREVDEYRIEPFGLYMARSAPGRKQFHYLESWLLPDLGLRITDFWFNPEHKLDQDFYLDIVHVYRDGPLWRVTDLYIDIVLRTGKDLRVLDTNELLDATIAGQLGTDTADDALRKAYVTVESLARHDYRLNRWLSTMDIPLRWLRH